MIKENILRLITSSFLVLVMQNPVSHLTHIKTHKMQTLLIFKYTVTYFPHAILCLTPEETEGIPALTDMNHKGDYSDW